MSASGDTTHDAPRSVETEAALYGMPLDGFTAARDALATQLKKDGDDGASKRVKALKKPSVAAWVVNQLARHAAGELEELFRLRAEIEAASSAAELRARTEERRKALTTLVAKARQTLAEGGHAASAATVEKVSQTLLAADEDTKEDILSGTLERELVSTGSSFGAFGSFDAATVTFDDDDVPDPRLERLRAAASEAEEVANRLEAEASEADAAASTARDRAAEARTRAGDARQKLEKAEKK